MAKKKPKPVKNHEPAPAAPAFESKQVAYAPPAEAPFVPPAHMDRESPPPKREIRLPVLADKRT